MKKHLNIKIYGKVQGVFFRDSARRKAEELGVTGFSKNMPDGTVYIEAEGEENDLEGLLGWCSEGSKYASVKKVEPEYLSEIKNFQDFIIKS